MLLLRIGCWFIVFSYAAASLTTFETIHGTWNGGSYSSLTMFNEGIVGYSFLAIIGVACFMWLKDWLTLTKEVQSLGHSDNLSLSMEVID
jgi:hypothetical protein